MKSRDMFVKSKFGIDPPKEEDPKPAEPDKAPADQVIEAKATDPVEPEPAPIEPAKPEVAPKAKTAVDDNFKPTEPEPIPGIPKEPRKMTIDDIKNMIDIHISNIDVYIGNKDAVMEELRALADPVDKEGKPKSHPSNYAEIEARIDSITQSVNAKLAVRDELTRLKGMF